MWTRKLLYERTETGNNGFPGVVGWNHNCNRIRTVIAQMIRVNIFCRIQEYIGDVAPQTVFVKITKVDQNLSFRIDSNLEADDDTFFWRLFISNLFVDLPK